MSETHPIYRFEAAVLIAIGGFAGSNLRYLVDGLVPGLGGTLLVNTLGSFLLGIVLYEALYSGLLASQTRTVVATGFLSSLTTYSTFALQTVEAPRWAVVNVVATYAFGFAGVLAGRAVARIIDQEGP